MGWFVRDGKVVVVAGIWRRCSPVDFSGAEVPPLFDLIAGDDNMGVNNATYNP